MENEMRKGRLLGAAALTFSFHGSIRDTKKEKRAVETENVCVPRLHGPAISMELNRYAGWRWDHEVLFFSLFLFYLLANSWFSLWENGQ
jgi:hypothetical protein